MSLFLAECLDLLKLSGSVMGHFMTFIEVGMHPTVRSTKRNETQRCKQRIATVRRI